MFVLAYVDPHLKGGSIYIVDRQSDDSFDWSFQLDLAHQFTSRDDAMAYVDLRYIPPLKFSRHLSIVSFDELVISHILES